LCLDRNKIWQSLVTAAKRFDVAMTEDQNRARKFSIDPKDKTSPDELLADLVENIVACTRNCGKCTATGDLVTAHRELAGLLAEMGNEIERRKSALVNHDDLSRVARARAMAKL